MKYSINKFEVNEKEVLFDDSKLDELQSNVSNTQVMIGDNTTMVYVLYKNLIVGRRYRLYIQNPNVELSDNSGANNRLVVNTYTDKNVTNIVTVPTSSSLNDYYDFTMPNDGTNVIRIGCRCKRNVLFPISLVDISDSYTMSLFKPSILNTSLIGDIVPNRLYKNIDGDLKYEEIYKDEWFLSPHIPCKEGDSVTVCTGDVYNDYRFVTFNKNREYVSSYVINANPRTITIKSPDVSYIRVPFNINNIGSYIQVNDDILFIIDQNFKQLYTNIISKIYEYSDSPMQKYTLVGSGVASDNVLIVKNVLPKHTYRIYIQDYENIPSGNYGSESQYKFSIRSYNDINEYTTLLTVNNPVPWSEYYDIIAPDDIQYFYIRTRCEPKYELNLYISDITDIVPLLNKKETSVHLTYNLIGNGTEQTTIILNNFIAGNRYRLYLWNNTADVEDNSGEYYRLSVVTYKDNEYITRIYAIPTSKELDKYYDFTMPNDGTNEVRIAIRCISGVSFPISLLDITGSSEDNSSILALNNSEFLSKMLSAKKRYYTSTDTEQKQPITIAHISDIHSNWTNVVRFLEFCNYYNSYIDILVNTGDTVIGDYDDGVDGYSQIVGVQNIINVIGNHDTRYNDENNNTDWQGKVGLPVYDMLIRPYISNWGVIQPSDADTNGYCYFYKDFVENNLRIIFIDIMGYDETEDLWLSNILDDSKNKNYHVLIATHFSASSDDSDKPAFEKIKCNYSSLYEIGTNTYQLNGYNDIAYLMMITVQSFIDNGGIFIGYMQGHYHTDFVAKVYNYPKQLIYSIGATKAGETRDYKHTIGTRNQDEFQIISIDTYLNIIKLYKVGANVDMYGRHKNSICINYISGEIISESF